MLIQGIMSKDASVWSQDEAEKNQITNRLGWVDSIDFCYKHLSEMQDFVLSVKAKNYTDCVLLGMGGSALAPEVFSSLIEKNQTLRLNVLDTTHAEQISALENKIDFQTTLFIISSKSGGTLETKFLMDYFFDKAAAILGQAAVGEHFVAITDGGSDLQEIAKNRGFYKTFINPSNIGGRFSALSFFGLIPAALIGLSLDTFLANTKRAIDVYHSSSHSLVGVELGEWIFSQYSSGSDKLAIFSDKKYSALVLWIEQLVAESLGKNGEGILPFLAIESSVLLDKVKKLDIQFATSDALSFEIIDEKQATLLAGQVNHLGEFFFHWEFATAYAAAKIGVNPFDEPNVSEAKNNTQLVLDRKGGVINYTKLSDLHDSLSFQDEGYLAILTYAPISAQNWQYLVSFKKQLGVKINIPIAISFGPRYLHSTGQLHKGGKQNGTFLIVVDYPKNNLDIPNSDHSFNDVLKAQAEGDYLALQKRGLNTVIVKLDDLSQLIS